MGPITRVHPLLAAVRIQVLDLRQYK